MPSATPAKAPDRGAPSGLQKERPTGYRLEQAQTLVTDFDRGDFDLSGDFYRMGGGSLGGKARGLAFVRRLLARQDLRDRFHGVEIAVPISAVLGTDIFDRFLDDNDLRWFAIECEDDAEIPVTWDQVSGAQVIVEAGLRDLEVTPSQGTHFFQNLTSFNLGYFTVNPDTGDGTVDWDWLEAQPSRSTAAHVRHIRLEKPILVLMNGKQNEGVVLKP